MIKFLGALLACISLTSATPVIAKESYSYTPNAVVRIGCAFASGTAFHIGDGKYVTAFHVVKNCLDTFPGAVIDKEKDFATFHGAVLPEKISFSCSSYRVGDMYVAVGYAEGGFYQAREPAVAVDYKIDGYQAFIGSFVPGMSGGPVLNKDGKAVGIVNMRWPARSLSLDDTYLCKE